jgi:hypothetical protein
VGYFPVVDIKATTRLREARARLQAQIEAQAIDRARVEDLNRQAREISDGLDRELAPFHSEIAAALEVATRTLGPWEHQATRLNAYRHVHGNFGRNCIAWLRWMLTNGNWIPHLRIGWTDHRLSGVAKEDLLDEADALLIKKGYILLEREEPDLAIQVRRSMRLEAAVSDRLKPKSHEKCCPACGNNHQCPCDLDERLSLTDQEIQEEVSKELKEYSNAQR